MIKIQERDIVILKSGLRALIVKVIHAQSEFSVFISSTGETLDINRKDIKSIVQYEEIPVTQ